MELELIEKEVKQIGDNLTTFKTAIEDMAKKSGADAAEAIKLANEIKTNIEGKTYLTPEDLKTGLADFQKQFDQLATIAKNGDKDRAGEFKTIDQCIDEKLKEMFPNRMEKGAPLQSELFKQMKSKSDKFIIELPEVKTMSLSASLTGDPVASYGPRQAILPSQLINLRDLIPTMNTETGLYVFYRENSGETNNIAMQTEGSVKGENNYALSEVKVVQGYVSGFTRFSKQMMNSLPWLTQVLPRMLTRDFFKTENSLFYNEVIQAATGVITSTETDSVKRLIDMIANQRSANFNASWAIVSPQARALLVKSTYTNGYYPGAGSVAYVGNTLTVDNTPIVSASWATNNKVLIQDADFLERVQVSGLAIELSYEDSDNFQRNLVTARVECQEEINLMLTQSAIYGNLVNV